MNEQAVELHPRWAQLIMPSLVHCDGKYHWQDVLDGLRDGRMQLWDYGDAAGVTWLEDYPRKRVLTMGFGGGNIESIKAALPDLARFARDQHCQSIEIHGRTGWQRALRDHGFEKISQTVRFEL